MSETSQKASVLVADIRELEAQLGQKKALLRGIQTEMKGELRQLSSIISPKIGSMGRPKGSALKEGELSVSKQVLNFIMDNPEGVTRSALLGLAPTRESAVHAAIRVHQQKGLVMNKEHKWVYCGPTSENTSADISSTDVEDNENPVVNAVFSA